MNLFKAAKQWSERPADERFQSLQDMHDACTAYREASRTASIPYNELRVEASGEDIALVGKTGVPATLTNWAMGQLSQKAGAPAGYLRNLPATLAAQNINHGLKKRGNDESDVAKLLFHNDGSLVLKSIQGQIYDRIWNNDITGRLLKLQQENPNWVNPLAFDKFGQSKAAATGIARTGAGQKVDNSAGRIIPDGMIPAGLYASDHDMFAFLVDESKTIEGSPAGLNRGFIVGNSEVGAQSFYVLAFLYDKICGNHIIWNATNVTEMRVRHVGDANGRAFASLAVDISKYANGAVNDIESTIQKAKTLELGLTSEQVLDSVLSMVARARIADLPKARIVDAINVAEQRQDRYGNPNTLWSVVSGITEHSQTIPHMDSRIKLDRAAGKLLEVAF